MAPFKGPQLTSRVASGTTGERKCHDFLPSFSPWRPFADQNDLGDFLLSFFGCWPNWRTKKGCATFCCPFGDFLASKTQKRTAKGHAAFFVLQKDAKKTPKGRRANFVLHLVGNLFWTPKGRLCKKDGKKSWHLHSAEVILGHLGQFSEKSWDTFLLTLLITLTCL